MDVKTILRTHWGSWAKDEGNWRRTCASMERLFVTDKSRYNWPDDHEKAARRLNRYDQSIAEAAERIISFKLPAQEKELLRLMYIQAPHLGDEILAKRIGVGNRQFDSICLSAHARFGRLWREAHREVA